MSKLKISQKIMLVLAILIGIFTISSIFNIVEVQKLQILQDEGARRADEAVTVQEGAGMGAKVYQIIADAEINRDLRATDNSWAVMMKELDDDFAKMGKIFLLIEFFLEYP